VHRLEQEARELLDRNWREGTYRGREYAFSVRCATTSTRATT
jgi:hypothetical protein